MIEAVIFDYGGVFSSPLFRGIGALETRMGYPPGSLLELLFGDSTYVGIDSRGAGLVGGGATVAEDHDWYKLETGQIGLAEWYEGVRRRAPDVIGTELDMGAYLQFLADMPVGVHWNVVHRARALRSEGMKVGLLTNNVKEWGDHWRETIPIDELFHVVIDSSEVGMRKPDPRVYELTCDRLGIAPGASVFVDDNADNIAAARALGMQAVHFGDDPFVAMDELDAVLAETRNGTK
ncbi:MAG TPA: HAD family phosphatase [Acidimicrobiia bacterium]